ncbi:hypothetical protein B0H14DRAFT_2586920 [Mycena olivaceomarginata]|nr:hypothetical protein B0H14DRAFT_2586920 [Mycena olivaceomarginata]
MWGAAGLREALSLRHLLSSLHCRVVLQQPRAGLQLHIPIENKHRPLYITPHSDPPSNRIHVPVAREAEPVAISPRPRRCWNNSTSSATDSVTKREGPGRARQSSVKVLVCQYIAGIVEADQASARLVDIWADHQLESAKLAAAATPAYQPSASIPIPSTAAPTPYASLHFSGSYGNTGQSSYSSGHDRLPMEAAAMVRVSNPGFYQNQGTANPVYTPGYKSSQSSPGRMLLVLDIMGVSRSYSEYDEYDVGSLNG